jgi:hypothetical protein
MRFIGGQTRKSNESTMLARFFGLPHGFEWLEGNIHDQNAPPNGEFTILRPKGMPIILVSPLDPKPPWGTLTKLQAFASHHIH